MPRAAIGIGSSLGNRVAVVQKAIAAIDRLQDTHVVSVSDLYETPPMGGVAENLFVNACAIVETALRPHELLQAMLAVEKELGRTRTRKWEDRTCDLDLLDYDGAVSEDPSLTLPHPMMSQRAFVLIPLAQIAPDMKHPVHKLTISQLTQMLSETEWASVRRIELDREGIH